MRMAGFCRLLQLLWKNSVGIHRKKIINVSEEVCGEEVNRKIISLVWNSFSSSAPQYSIL